MYTNTILHGDCLQVLSQLPAESVNFILTDPPISRGTSRATGAPCRVTTTRHGSSPPLSRCTVYWRRTAFA